MVVCRWWRKETTPKKGGGGFFSGDFGTIFGVLWAIFALLVADAGRRIGFSLFLGPGGCWAPQARKSHGRGFLGGDFVARYGRSWAKSHARDSRHTGGREPPRTSACRHRSGGGLTQPQPPQPGWGGWVVGSGGKRTTPWVIFFSAALLPFGVACSPTLHPHTPPQSRFLRSHRSSAWCVQVMGLCKHQPSAKLIWPCNDNDIVGRREPA